MTIFDPFGLSAIGCGVVLAGYIFARIEKRNIRCPASCSDSRGSDASRWHWRCCYSTC